MSQKKKLLTLSGFLFVAGIVVALFGFEATQITLESINSSATFSMLASKLGIRMASAGAIIDVISNGSTIFSIVSAVAGLTGAGLIAVGGVVAIKAVIKNQGKKFATGW